MKINVVNEPLLNKVKKCTSDYKTRNLTRKNHNGMDLTSYSSKDNYVIAIEDGIISNTSYDNSSGYYVFVQHKNGYKSFYCHLKKDSVLVKKGQEVKKGEKLGLMGNTGNSRGVHLHFGVKNDKSVWVDPKPYLEGTQNFNSKEKPINDDIGLWEVISPRYVRTGPHTTYRIKKVSELSVDGKKHAVNSKLTSNAQYKKGTRFNVYEVQYSPNGAKWGRSPSGWICLISSKNTKYCKKTK